MELDTECPPPTDSSVVKLIDRRSVNGIGISKMQLGGRSGFPEKIPTYVYIWHKHFFELQNFLEFADKNENFNSFFKYVKCQSEIDFYCRPASCRIHTDFYSDCCLKCKTYIDSLENISVWWFESSSNEYYLKVAFRKLFNDKFSYKCCESSIKCRGICEVAITREHWSESAYFRRTYRVQSSRGISDTVDNNEGTSSRRNVKSDGDTEPAANTKSTQKSKELHETNQNKVVRIEEHLLKATDNKSANSSKQRSVQETRKSKRIKHKQISKGYISVENRCVPPMDTMDTSVSDDAIKTLEQPKAKMPSNVNTNESSSCVQDNLSQSLDVSILDKSTESEPLNSSAPHYFSNESGTDDMDRREEPKIKKTRGAGKDWIVVDIYSEQIVAEDKMSSLTDFTRDYNHDTSDGRKIYFSCKHKNCPAMYQLFYNNTSVVMLKSLEHVHTTTTVPVRLSRIPEPTKSKIDEYRKLKLKPKAIVSTLRSRHPELQTPTLKQIYGLNARENKDQHKISLGELEHWISERLTIPNDDDAHTVFVVNYNIDYDIPCFRFFLSTRNLLSQTNKSKIMHADTTYKLNYEGFPVLVVGVTDLDRHLHPSGIAVCMDEQTEDFEFIFNSIVIGIYKECAQSFQPTTLVADAAGAIHNGFTKVFGEKLIIMCWAHLKRAVKKRYKGKPFLDSILSDLDLLQLAPSVESFQIALKLFLEKWNKEEEFVEYFKEQWVNQNCNWFEGIQKLTPKTDNALEGKNRWIKDSHTMRERPPLAQFLGDLIKMVNDWSCEYIQDKEFACEQTMDLPTWTKSYQWVKSGKRVTVVRHGDENVSYIFKVPATGFDTVIEFDLNKCKSLDEFKKYVFAYYIVEMPPNDWKKVPVHVHRSSKHLFVNI